MRDDRMREAESELLRVAKNLCSTQRLPALEAAIEEYEAAKDSAPNRRLRRMARR